MSCTDSKTPKKRKSLKSGNMGDVIGKEPDEAETDEMSQGFSEVRPAREDADGAPSSEEQPPQLKLNTREMVRFKFVIDTNVSESTMLVYVYQAVFMK